MIDLIESRLWIKKSKERGSAKDMPKFPTYQSGVVMWPIQPQSDWNPDGFLRAQVSKVPHNRLRIMHRSSLGRILVQLIPLVPHVVTSQNVVVGACFSY